MMIDEKMLRQFEFYQAFANHQSHLPPQAQRTREESLAIKKRRAQRKQAKQSQKKNRRIR